MTMTTTVTNPSRRLAHLLDGASLVVCLGPGGVGKTTLSSVFALRQAAAGRRSLVLTIDPARRLADALSLGGLTNDPIEVTSFRKMHPRGTLSALMLDPATTFDHMIALLVGDPARRAALMQNRFYQHISRSLAGTLEYMAVERLHELTRTGDFEAIVLDTPPTTNAIDFLEAPDRLASFFNEKVTRWFLPSRGSDGQRHRGWGSRLFGRAGAGALALLSKVAGDTFVEETVGFFAAFADLLADFRARGVEIGKLLRAPRTVFLIVCAPDASRLAEAREIDRRLSEAGCRAQGFVVNRVDTAIVPEALELEQAVTRASAMLGDADDPARVRSFLERIENVRRRHASSAAAHLAAVAELRAYAGGRPVFTAPQVPPGESPRAALLALYLGLFSDELTAADAA